MKVMGDLNKSISSAAVSFDTQVGSKDLLDISGIRIEDVSFPFACRSHKMIIYYLKS